MSGETYAGQGSVHAAGVFCAVDTYHTDLVDGENSLQVQDRALDVDERRTPVVWIGRVSLLEAIESRILTDNEQRGRGTVSQIVDFAGHGLVLSLELSLRPACPASA
ncbi:MAG: hypothetical protein M3069_29335 [Chloroflexota bacterium]|nr:hypothetical protein [Chloroflexota bacterium]